MNRFAPGACTVVVLLALLTGPPAFADAPEQLAARAVELLSPVEVRRKAAIAMFVERGKADAAPAFIDTLRFYDNRGAVEILDILEKLTGARPGRTWNDWMLWQETHPETGVMPGYAAFKGELLGLIDVNFKRLVGAGMKHEIRLEEIAWGGVPVDGIPSLDAPKTIRAGDAAFLTPEELVFGVSINGETRAYPLRIMDWHEMTNDVVGGVPFALAYCTLCGSGILYETKLEGRAKPLIFGSSGLLYRSNKLMFDRETDSLWNQFTGRPVVGTLTGSGLELRTRPLVIASWQAWKTEHPDTTVLSLDTGHRRNYSLGEPYGDYFASPDLMFPAAQPRRELQAKDYVFVLRDLTAPKAWSLKLFEGGAVINDTAGVLDVVLIGDAATRTVRAYRGDGRTFSKASSTADVAADGVQWRISEDALTAPDGTTLGRLPGHIAYWFAFANYFGGNAEVRTTP
jgi:hypothetical protein